MTLEVEGELPTRVAMSGEELIRLLVEWSGGFDGLLLQHVPVLATSTVTLQLGGTDALQFSLYQFGLYLCR